MPKIAHFVNFNPLNGFPYISLIFALYNDRFSKTSLTTPFPHLLGDQIMNFTEALGLPADNYVS